MALLNETMKCQRLSESEGTRHFLVLFSSTHDAISADSKWADSGFSGKLRPVPRAISSSCGLCLETKLPGDANLLQALAQCQITWRLIIEVRGNNLVPLPVV